MKLFDEINHFINIKNIERSIFDILSLYDQKIENIECLKLIDQLISKIKEAICIYQKTKNESLYNIIDNDFVTLKDLFEEYKKEVYPLFSVKSLMLLSTLKENELHSVYKYLTIFNNEIRFESIINSLTFAVFKTIDYIDDDSFKQKIKDFLNNNTLTEPVFEAIISSIKKIKKEKTNDQLDKEYLKLIAVYFYYLYKEGK